MDGRLRNTMLESSKIIIKYGKESESEQALIIPDRSVDMFALKELGFSIKGITKENLRNLMKLKRVII